MNRCGNRNLPGQKWHSNEEMDMEVENREWRGGKCTLVFENSVDGLVGSGMSGGTSGLTNGAGQN
jgi:hypothetical protein